MSDEKTHWYGSDDNDTEPTTRIDLSGHGSQQSSPPNPSAPHHDAAEHADAMHAVTADPSSPRNRSRAGAAALLTAALLLGGLGGVAGSMAYNSSQTDEGPSDPASTTVATGSTSDSAERTPLQTGNGKVRTEAPVVDGSPQAVAEAVLPSVVKINVQSADAGGAGSGSGVILSDNGEILTNNHVVEVADGGGQISVNFNDGSSALADVVGTDPVTDLAVIQAREVSGLLPAAIGDSEALKVGEQVVAIGSPFGLEATVTTGIVSSLNRPVSVGESNPNAVDTGYPAIQTDAAINPGNSGGPLVNLNGEVVGINSSIRTSSDSQGSIGLGFAIPISKVLAIVEQLRNGETATHARLGVTVSTSAGDAGITVGAAIEEISQGSAAEKAGIQAGDIVTRVNDDVITTVDGLVATIRGYRPGEKVAITVLRDGDEQQLSAVLDSDLE